MKKCTTCLLDLPLSDFHLKGRTLKDGTQPHEAQCYQCRRLQRLPLEKRGAYLDRRRWRQEQIKAGFTREKLAEHWWRLQRDGRKAFIIGLKRKPCLDCGGVYPVQVMDFDHRPEAGPKRFQVSSGAFKHSRESVLAEIAKCDLVCANCHRVRTVRRRSGLPATLPEPEYFI